jgi:hypothetical protein
MKLINFLEVLKLLCVLALAFYVVMLVGGYR